MYSLELNSLHSKDFRQVSIVVSSPRYLVLFVYGQFGNLNCNQNDCYFRVRLYKKVLNLFFVYAMNRSAFRKIQIIPEFEEQMALGVEQRIVRRNNRHQSSVTKKIAVATVMIVVVVATAIALCSLYKQPDSSEMKEESIISDKQIDSLLNQLDSNDTSSIITDYSPSGLLNEEESIQIPEIKDPPPQVQTKIQLQPATSAKYKKLVTFQSSYYTNRALSFYIRKRSKTFEQLLASYKRQDQQVILGRLVSLNLTMSQFQRALSLIEHSPFLEIKEEKVEAIIAEERAYLQQKYDISHFSQLPMCIVVPSFRNYRRYRYFFNLYTILQQQYDNYHVIIIDDASDDRTGESLEQQISNNNFASEKVKLIRNTKREHHMANIYKAVYQHCRKGEVLMIIDGDDQLIGKYVFKLINAAYHQLRSLAIYTNHIQSKREILLDIGISRPYSASVKTHNSYRYERHYYSHLRSTWVDLFLLVKEDAFKDKNGQWFTNAVDNAIFYPIFEMSCGEVEYLNEITYKYNTYTGNNVDNMKEEYRKSTSEEIRGKQQYRCLKEWNLQAYESIKSYIKNE